MIGINMQLVGNISLVLAVLLPGLGYVYVLVKFHRINRDAK